MRQVADLQPSLQRTAGPTPGLKTHSETWAACTEQDHRGHRFSCLFDPNLTAVLKAAVGRFLQGIRTGNEAKKKSGGGG